MSSDAITAVLFSPVGVGASACVLLALGLLVAPAPRRAMSARWALGCVLLAVILGVLALGMVGIGDDWHGGGMVLLCAVAFAVTGMWMARAPLPWQRSELQRATEGAVDEDDDGLGRPRDPSPVTPKPSFDWDAFDRARAAWGRVARPCPART